MSPQRIALCFLVTKNIVNLDVWKKWWEGNEHLINIYAHFSQIGSITQPELLENRVDPVPTKWGDISLIYAEAQLYKKAIQDKTNVSFILISDTCIPVRSFKKIYQRLTADKKRGLVAYRSLNPYEFRDDVAPFIKDGDCDSLLKKYGMYGKKVYASDQWKALSRSNAKDFIKMLEDTKFKQLYETCIKVVPDSLAPDELMYVNWMNRKYKGHLSSQFRGGGTTFVDFKGKAIHPIDYKQMTKNLSDDICETNSLFARKFPKPIESRLIKQTPVECYKKHSIRRGSMEGKYMKIKKSKSRRKSRKARKSTRKSRKSIRKSRKARKSTRKSRKARKSRRKSRKARKSRRKSRKARKSRRKSRKARKSRRKSRKARKSRRKSRKARKSRRKSVQKSRRRGSK